MEKGLVSIIVPIYNVEKYLEEAVKSAVFQTYEKKEIILVDDGSPDNCPKLCDEFAKKYKNVTVVHKKNGGLSDARNAGIEVANGEYLYFFDSDDVIHPQMIEFLVEAYKDCDCDYIECGYKEIGEDESPTHDIQTIENGEIVGIKTLYKNLLSDWSKNVPMVWTKLYKAETFKNLKFEKGKIHEDEILISELFATLNKVKKIPNKLYCYRIREGSIMTKPYSEKRTVIFDCLKRRYEVLKTRDNCLAKNTLVFMANMFYQAIQNIKLPTTENKVELLNLILEKIKPLQNEILKAKIPSYFKKGIKIAFKSPQDFLNNFDISKFTWFRYKF